MAFILTCYSLTAILIATFIVFLPGIIGLSSDTLGSKEFAAAEEILILHKRIWPAVFITFSLTVVFSLYLLNRIFGPLYRFRIFYKEIAQGRIGRYVKIRKSDFVHREEEEFNFMIRSLTEEIDKIKNVQSRLKDEVGDLKRGLGDSLELSPELVSTMTKVEDLSDELDKRLSFFQLEKHDKSQLTA